MPSDIDALLGCRNDALDSGSGCGFVQGVVTLMFTHTSHADGSQSVTASVTSTACSCFGVRNCLCVPLHSHSAFIIHLVVSCDAQVHEAIYRVPATGGDQTVTGDNKFSSYACFSDASPLYVYTQSGISSWEADDAGIVAYIDDSYYNEYAPLGGGDASVPIPNTTWLVNGQTLTSFKPVTTQPAPAGGAARVTDWTGMGIITLQSHPVTVFITETKQRSLWPLLGFISGVYTVM